jgi:hypothetical protein
VELHGIVGSDLLAGTAATEMSLSGLAVAKGEVQLTW